MTVQAIEEKCGTCQHFSGGQNARCRCQIPFFAEHMSAVRVYAEDGFGCAAYQPKGATE